MDGTVSKAFNIEVFLSTVGVGRTISRFNPRQTFFLQGSAADAVYYLLGGRAKLSVVSKRGKEATVTLLAAGDFFGEESMAGTGSLRTASAAALTTCIVLRITTEQMKQVLHDEHSFSDFFLQFIILRGMRTQEDLVDQLFNSSERRLARTLLLMAEFGTEGAPLTLIPRVTQETLASMVGTTRSRVSFFMNRFKKLGLIDYNGRIRVHKALLDAVLRDELPDQNASKPVLLDPKPSRALTAKRAKRTGATPVPKIPRAPGSTLIRQP
jgi:CRP/FNR family cyclic AMP-dependent transcriptional regulator